MGLLDGRQAADEPGLGLTLGVAEVRLVDLANAYVTLARGGRHAPPVDSKRAWSRERVRSSKVRPAPRLRPITTGSVTGIDAPRWAPGRIRRIGMDRPRMEGDVRR